MKPRTLTPRSVIPLFFQITARISGNPVSGSIKPFCEAPATQPREFIQFELLLLPPGSAPRSVKMPSCHSNAR